MLALARNLAAYVGDTLVSTHELRANSWGTAAAGAARIAGDEYLGDVSDLARAATVFQGWLGDRSKYAGFKFGALAWQAVNQRGRNHQEGRPDPGKERRCRATRRPPMLRLHLAGAA